MPNKICFLYTETTGLHQENKDVEKKKLYLYARLVRLNYEIGYIDNTLQEFVIEKDEKIIVKPRSMYIPKETTQFHGLTQEIANKEGSEIETILLNLKDDLKNVSIIVSHNIDFHLRTLISEFIRYNISIDFSNYVIIDTISFFHDYGFIKLKDLATKLKIKEIGSDNNSNKELIRQVFFKLYKKFKKSIK
jgi:DNA polymerase III epsilon subunit-like protein